MNETIRKRLVELRSLDSFDFSFNSSNDRRLVYDLAAGRFVNETLYVVLIDPPGVSKSHQPIADKGRKDGALPIDLRRLGGNLRGLYNGQTQENNDSLPQMRSADNLRHAHQVTVAQIRRISLRNT